MLSNWYWLYQIANRLRKKILSYFLIRFWKITRVTSIIVISISTVNFKAISSEWKYYLLEGGGRLKRPRKLMKQGTEFSKNFKGLEISKGILKPFPKAT